MTIQEINETNLKDTLRLASIKIKQDIPLAYNSHTALDNINMLSLLFSDKYFQLLSQTIDYKTFLNHCYLELKKRRDSKSKNLFYFVSTVLKGSTE